MFRRKNRPDNKIAKLGFTLIELAIVLGVIGVLSGGLWRLMSAGSQQTKDSATAAQHAALISAVNGFLADPAGQAWMQSLTQYNAYTLPLPTSNNSTGNCQNSISGGPTGSFAAFCNYLPAGFTNSTPNPYGQTYEIQVVTGPILQPNNPPVSYSFMILASATGTSNTIPDTDGGRISGLIGGDGGFIYTSPAVCNITSPGVCGALGAWSLPNINTSPGGTSTGSGYGFSAAQNGHAASAGSVVSRTFVSAQTGNGDQWLARVLWHNNVAYNTMTTDMYMGTNASTGTATDIHLGGTNIIYGGTATSMAQISLVAPSPSGYTNSPVYVSTAGCTQLTQIAGCPSTNLTYYDGSGQSVNVTTIIPAINVISGDVSVADGEVIALKIYSASDARLKTNIHPIDDPLGNLMKIAPVAFTFKQGGSESMGVTAQDLEKTYPQLVSNNNGKKFVEYNGLIGPLIGAVQELKRQNDDLRMQLSQQKLRQDKLEHELARRRPEAP